MIWQTKLAEIGFAFLLLFGCYLWVGHNAVENYKDEVAVEQAKANKEQQDKYNTLSESFESLKLNRQVEVRTVTKRVEKIVEREVYRNVCIDDEGLEVANKALEGKL